MTVFSLNYSRKDLTGILKEKTKLWKARGKLAPDTAKDLLGSRVNPYKKEMQGANLLIVQWGSWAAPCLWRCSAVLLAKSTKDSLSLGAICLLVAVVMWCYGCHIRDCCLIFDVLSCFICVFPLIIRNISKQAQNSRALNNMNQVLRKMKIDFSLAKQLMLSH